MEAFRLEAEVDSLLSDAKKEAGIDTRLLLEAILIATALKGNEIHEFDKKTAIKMSFDLQAIKWAMRSYFKFGTRGSEHID